MSNTKAEYQELKQQQVSYFSKFMSILYMIFLGQKTIPLQINRSVISNTYLQIIETIHVVSLYSLFVYTNNKSFSTIQSIMSGAIILICFIPRISNKHIIFYITAILIILVSLGSIASSKIIIQNYLIFRFLCNTISDYYIRNPQKIFNSKATCVHINNLYILQLSAQAVYVIFRIVYLFLIFKAYNVAKLRYDEDEKKKRRRIKYNQTILKRVFFNKQRKA